MRAAELRRDITEQDFQAAVVDVARMYGWRVHHSRPAMRADGSWRTPIQGDPGWPDLALAKGGTLILAELKSERGALSAGQREWIAAIPAIRVWRPSDMPEIVALLSRPVRAGGAQ